MKNLTPHSITILNKNGEKITIEPSGIVARVSVSEEIAFVCPYTGLDVIKREFTSVENIPSEEGVYIVSALVLEAIKKNNKKNNSYFYAPDTGNTAIRNEAGQIIAVTRLVTI